YEMLAGHPPFEGTVHQVVLANIKKDAPPIANADPLLDLFARKLMARDAAKRIATPHDAPELPALIHADPDRAALACRRPEPARAAALVGLPDPRKLPDE